VRQGGLECGHAAQERVEQELAVVGWVRLLLLRRGRLGVGVGLGSLLLMRRRRLGIGVGIGSLLVLVVLVRVGGI
jgi:hypothetical protein